MGQTNNGKKKTLSLTDELKIIIKQEFIEGYIDEEGVRRFPSIDALVKRHNVARATLFSHSAKENWQKTKNEFLTKLERQTQSVRLKELVEQGKKLDTNSLQLAQSLMVKVSRQLVIDENRFNDPAEPDYRGLSAVVLERLSIVIGNAQKIGKLALGEAQEISKVHADVTAPESFNDIMEQLDELREQRSEGSGYTIQ
jgi:hypothetical protein